MIDCRQHLSRVRNVASGISALGSLSIPLVFVAVATLGLIEAPPQQAYANTLVFIQDQPSCESSPISGNWEDNTNTCTLFGGLNIDGNEDVEIASGVTVVLSNNTQSEIGFGGTLYVANGGVLNIQGKVFNSGTISNSGILTVNTQYIAGTGIFSNGTITNSGVLSVFVYGEDNTGIRNFGTIDNSGTIEVSATGGNFFGSYNTGIFGAGTINNSHNINIVNDGFTVGIHLVSGAINNTGSGLLAILNLDLTNGIWLQGGSTITNSGTLIIVSGDTLGNGIELNGSTITNSGTLTLSNSGGTGIGNYLSSAITNTNSGILTVENSGESYGILIRESDNSDIVNSGLMTISNSGTASYGIRMLNGGSLSNAGVLNVANTGPVSVGILNDLALLTNEGTLSVADNGNLTIGINNIGTINNLGDINNFCGTIINSGTFTGNPVNDLCDSDNDGISDNVDVQPNSTSDDFADFGLGGNTSGTIISRGDQTLSIQDSANATLGVRIHADPSGIGNAAEVSVCDGSAIYTLSEGDDIVVTCGSATTQVVQGPVDVQFIATDGSASFASIPAGNILTFYPDTATYEAGADNAGSISITTGGNTFTIEPGEIIEKIQASIDIKPSGTPNTINIKKDMTVTVALLGSASFDINTVDKTSLKFGGTTLQPAAKTSLQDVNADSLLDIVVQFKVPALGFAVSDTEGCLFGLTLDGTPIVGCDSVRIINK
jgi:hypothetical protein